MAAEKAARDFLGIERLAGRVGSTCRKIECAGLTNARVMRFEISYAVEHLLPPSSIAAFYLLFPDPWPKRRHAARRLVNDAFLGSLHRALVAGGKVQIATDEADYFRQITRAVSNSRDFVIVPNSASVLPVTKFERGFRDRGVPIHRLELRKVSPVT
jgi:tRNA (guanine-N7-)-methyltransferase